MTSLACPCCGALVVRPTFAEIGAAMRLSTFERRIFDRLARVPGQWVLPDQLIDAVYFDDPDGGPSYARGCIQVALVRLRRKIAPHGAVIETSLGRSNGERRIVWEVKETLTGSPVSKKSLTSVVLLQ